MPYARYFPFAPPSQLPTLLPLASGWIRPMGDPQKELRGREENRAKAFFYWLQMQCHLRVTDWPCLSSGGHSPPVQLPLQFPKTAASPCPFRPKDGNGSLLLLAPGYCNI